jgi:bifunctional non-homologous end joining protein LigD
VTDKHLQVGDRTVKVSSLDKVFFPDAGLTKGDVIDYYRRIAGTMIPHTRGRPVTMHRYPDGIDGKDFYQKEVPNYFPGWITRVSVPVEEEGGEEQPQVVCDDAATLVYLANQASIPIHVWLSCVDNLDHPDKMIFDLDPPGDFETVRRGAKALREMLEEVGLVPFVMTTGSRGLHVVVPLDRRADFDTTRKFARDLAQVLVRREPERYTVEMSKKERGDRLFLDYLRNSYAQHGVAPYSVRALPGAPVATPLDWHELSDKELDSQSYTIQNIFRRLGQKEDPWKDFRDHARSIEEARDELDQMMEQEGE